MTWADDLSSGPWPGGDDPFEAWEQGEEPDADDADDEPQRPTSPLLVPGATNIPPLRSAREQEEEDRARRQWPYADDPPWDPGHVRADDIYHSTIAPWPLPQPPPIAEPEP